MAFPSARISHRVPFGTGRRMAEAVVKDNNNFLVYDFRVFVCVRELLAAVSTYQGEGAEQIYACLKDPPTTEFLERRGFPRVWERFRSQYKTNPAILTAFHRWFDGFVTLKYIHWLTEKKWPRVSLKDIPGADVFPGYRS
jgi:hypothetical protein